MEVEEEAEVEGVEAGEVVVEEAAEVVADITITTTISMEAGIRDKTRIKTGLLVNPKTGLVRMAEVLKAMVAVGLDPAQISLSNPEKSQQSNEPKLFWLDYTRLDLDLHRLLPSFLASLLLAKILTIEYHYYSELLRIILENRFKGNWPTRRESKGADGGQIEDSYGTVLS